MQTIGTHHGWKIGLFFKHYAASEQLVFAHAWVSEPILYEPIITRIQDMKMSKGIGFIGRIWRRFVPLLSNDLSADSSLIQNIDPTINAAIGIPIYTENRLIGILQVLCRPTR